MDRTRQRTTVHPIPLPSRERAERICSSFQNPMSARIACSSVSLASAPRVSHATRASKLAAPRAAASRGGARLAKVRTQFTFRARGEGDQSVRGHNCLVLVPCWKGPGVGALLTRPYVDKGRVTWLPPSVPIAFSLVCLVLGGVVTGHQRPSSLATPPSIATVRSPALSPVPGSIGSMRHPPRARTARVGFSQPSTRTNVTSLDSHAALLLA